MTTMLLTLLACGDKDGSNDDSAAPPSVFDEIINAGYGEAGGPIDPVGEFACYTPGGSWLTQTPDASCKSNVPFTGVIEDFETGDTVPEANLELFFGDRFVDGGEDFATVSDASGNVTGEIATCTPTTYRVWTDPDLDETVVTIQGHEIYKHASSLDLTFNSVSSTTYSIIPSLLGVSVEPGKGVVAGTAYDCNGDGNPIQGARVIAKDSSGAYIEGQTVKYFVDEFPKREQPYTSEDGLWVVINVPPDRITVEMYTWDAGSSAYVLQGDVGLDVTADSINIANVFTGYGGETGGIVYPAECLSACSTE